ncbi:unnamed protein product [Laminaria digitata]
MELGPTLTEFYAPATSSARKQQLEQGLHAFRTLPNAHLSSLEIILAIGQRREQEDLFVLYFCGCTIEGAIRRRWSSIPKEERLHVRKFLFQFLGTSHASLPRWVVTKLGKALVDVGKVSWPQEDSDFLTEILQLASSLACFAYLLACLPTYFPPLACLLAFFLACLPVCSLACFAYLLACLPTAPACLLACFPDVVGGGIGCGDYSVKYNEKVMSLPEC